MTVRAINDYDLDLIRRTCRYFQIAQGLLGAFLLINTILPLVHGVAAAFVLAILLLVSTGWHNRAARVIARVLTALPLVLCALLLTDLFLYWWEGLPLQGWIETLCIVGGSLLSYFMVGTTWVGLKGGRYDKVVACFVSACLALTALVAVLFEPARNSILWGWDHPLVRYIWLALVGTAALLTWMGCLLRTPEQKAAAKAAKEKRREAKRKCKTGEN